MSLANLNLWLHLVTGVFLVALQRAKWPPFGPVRFPLLFLAPSVSLVHGS